MGLSNYPPGVTGYEPHIAGPSAAWEKMYESSADDLMDLFTSHGADVPNDVFRKLHEEVVTLIENHQGEAT